MSINGFNPNLLMNTMAPMQSTGAVQNQPVSLLANPLQPQSTLSNAALDTSNPMNALGQLFTMLTSLLTQLFSGGMGNTTPTQSYAQNNQQPSYNQPSSYNSGNGGNALGSLATMLQELIANLSQDESVSNSRDNAADYSTTNNDSEEVAADTSDDTATVTNKTETGDDSVVTTTNNDAGRDIKNITTTISDSGNTYNITIQMEPKGKGGAEDRGDRNKPGHGKPAADKPPAYNPPETSYDVPDTDSGDCDQSSGDINNNTTNINNGDGTINNNTTNINGDKGNINNNDTNINYGDGDINNNTTNINGAEDCEETPPPAEDCPPEEPPAYEDGGDSQYYGDPHFVGFGGEKYDVMGEVGKTYNILSDKDLQYNAEFAAWGKPDENGVQPTVINKAGITSGKDQIEYDLNGTPKLNGKAMESGKDYTLDASGKAKWDGSKMHFENSEYSIDLSRDPANKDAILSNVKVRDGVNPLADGVNPHGLLGQTADGVKGERVGKNADGTEKTDKSSKQGGTVIDGAHTDYQVSGLLDTEFEKHNQFAA